MSSPLAYAGRDSASAERSAPPGPLAPYVYDCWYVVGSRNEFDRTLRQRWILGEPVCFYRATDGTPVVLDDRCAHRRFPLSRSTLDEDLIVCGYHGFTYGRDGRCVRVPTGGNPRAIRVRSYPVAERGPWVWMWTGADPADADLALIPWPISDEDGGDLATGYTLNPANYSLIHENLLDLSHFEYLHGIDPGYVGARSTLLADEELPSDLADIAVGHRHSFDSELGVWAIPAGDNPQARVTRTDDLISTPSISYGIGTVEPHDPAATTLRKYLVAHCLTPLDNTNTHQFWTWWQDVPFAIPKEEWTGQIAQVFDQDVDAVRWVQEYTSSDHRVDFVERSAASDTAGLKLRRKLQQLAANASG